MKEIEFYRVDEEYGCFSNFSPHPIILDGTKWRTSEHYFQAQKFLDDEIVMQIMMAEMPKDAADLGRSRSLPLRKDWENIKDRVMHKAVKAKFEQHFDIRELLLSTGSSLIVEHTPSDSYWGDGGDGSGKNTLGRILMEVREELATRGTSVYETIIVPPWEKYPNCERESILWSMGEHESYLYSWGVWFRGLDEKEKSLYRDKYKEPSEWSGFYK